MQQTEQAAEVIAHELNNVLMAISLSLEILGEHCAATDKTQHLLELARDSIERGAYLNQQLLNIAKRQPPCQLAHPPQETRPANP
ncbi:hypothetical protein KVP09_03425 [Alcaligenaceae bacterium CGII-47]|nr:hypothetical protein [Alcaligenaceae bacterium CGII-47]